MRLVSAFGLELRGVGVRLVNIARPHRHLAADVVYFVRNAVRALFRDRHVVERMHAALGDVVDVGEVANHVTVVEHLDGLALRDGAGKQHRAHVRAFPGQSRGRALAARSRGVTPRLPRLEGRAHLTSGPPGPTGFDP